MLKPLPNYLSNQMPKTVDNIEESMAAVPQVHGIQGQELVLRPQIIPVEMVHHTSMEDVYATMLTNPIM